MRILTPSVISGSPHDIGYGLGMLARPAMNAYAWHKALRGMP